MDVEKLRNLTDAELLHQQRELNDQLFRLKFQMKMGQTESLNKVRGLRKDVARIKTIQREKELGLDNHAKPVTAEAASPAASSSATASKGKPAGKKPAAKKTAAKAAKPAAKKAAGAKAKARKK
jgi:large subunit ribosomal protein L29